MQVGFEVYVALGAIGKNNMDTQTIQRFYGTHTYEIRIAVVFDNHISLLALLQEFVVIGMAANPKPGNGVAFQPPQGAMFLANPDRVDWILRVNSFEM